MATRVTGFGAASLGVVLLVTVLVGSTASTASNYWCKPAVIAALVISGTTLAVGLWALGSVFLGLPWPDTHAERAEKRRQRYLADQEAYYSQRDALQEIIDELEGLRRDLGNELENKRVFGISHSGTAWAKNNHVLNAPALAENRKLVHDAYLQTHALNQRNRERYDAASDDDVSNPAWQALTEEETKQRQEAFNAVEKAWLAVLDVKLAEDQKWLDRSS